MISSLNAEEWLQLAHSRLPMASSISSRKWRNHQRSCSASVYRYRYQYTSTGRSGSSVTPGAIDSWMSRSPFNYKEDGDRLDEALISFDLFSNSQRETMDRKFEWWETTSLGATDAMHKMLMITLPCDQPMTLTKARCIFETFTCCQTKSRFEIGQGLLVRTWSISLLFTGNLSCFYCYNTLSVPVLSTDKRNWVIPGECTCM
jgi:hypothetical protein